METKIDVKASPEEIEKAFNDVIGGGDHLIFTDKGEEVARAIPYKEYAETLEKLEELRAIVDGRD